MTTENKCPVEHKVNKIKFRTADEDAYRDGVFQPVPASKAKPEWYNNLRIYRDNSDKSFGNMSAKACPSIHDWFQSGYIIRTNKTILVLQEFGPQILERMHEDELAEKARQGEKADQRGCAFVLKDDINTFEEAEKLKERFFETKELTPNDNYDDSEIHLHIKIDARYNITGGHNGGQLLGSHMEDKMSIKFRTPWTVSTPEGYSCYWLDPFMHYNPYFMTWQGIMDTDKWNQVDTNCITILYPKIKGNFIIPKGTPIVQIVPFRREHWEHELVFEEDGVLDYMDDPMIKAMDRRTRSNEQIIGTGDNKVNLYRKEAWTPKKFK